MSKTRKQIRTELRDLFIKDLSVIMTMANIKKSDMARELGISKQTIANWINDDLLDSVGFLCLYHSIKIIWLRKISKEGSSKSVKAVYVPLITQYIHEIENEMKKGLF